MAPDISQHSEQTDFETGEEGAEKIGLNNRLREILKVVIRRRERDASEPSASARKTGPDAAIANPVGASRILWLFRLNGPEDAVEVGVSLQVTAFIACRASTRYLETTLSKRNNKR